MWQITQKETAPKYWMAHWVLTALCAMHAALLWPVKFLFFCMCLLIFNFCMSWTDKLTDVGRGDITLYLEDVERRSVEDRSVKWPDLIFY
jgi:hypothetical protein